MANVPFTTIHLKIYSFSIFFITLRILFYSLYYFLNDPFLIFTSSHIPCLCWCHSNLVPLWPGSETVLWHTHLRPPVTRILKRISVKNKDISIAPQVQTLELSPGCRPLSVMSVPKKTLKADIFFPWACFTRQPAWRSSQPWSIHPPSPWSRQVQPCLTWWCSWHPTWGITKGLLTHQQPDGGHV